jgi:mono/diheme cytochrome c family protein
MRTVEIGLILICAMLASACSPESGSGSDSKRGAARGAEIFDENCGVCHGADGRGPSLAEITGLSSAERRDGIRNHPVAGQIPQRLPANELADVIGYLETE